MLASFVLINFHHSNQNSYNSNTSHNPMRPALAAKIQGDKSAFYKCGFVGLQDTLWDVQGRHYFKYCTIQGAVDFIFGSGQSLYEVPTFQTEIILGHPSNLLVHELFLLMNRNVLYQ